MPGTIHDPIGGQSRATIAAKQAKPTLDDIFEE